MRFWHIGKEDKDGTYIPTEEEIAVVKHLVENRALSVSHIEAPKDGLEIIQPLREFIQGQTEYPEGSIRIHV